MRTRREFMAGAVMMAAGAAVGFCSTKVHGPVDLNFEFFGPIKLKTMLSSDEKTDSFEVRVLAAPGPDTFVRFKLSDIRRAVSELTYTQAEVSNRNVPTDKMPMYMHLESGKLMFVTAIHDAESSRFWMDLADVKRVL